MSTEPVPEGAEIQLFADENGLAVVGPTNAVEQFLAAEGLTARPSSSALGLSRLKGMLGTGAAVAEAGSEIGANSARWVKLSEESAKAIDKYGLRTSAKTQLQTGVLKGEKGQVKGFVEFVRGPGTTFTNPAVLAGAAGVMAQLAMQQTMDEVTDYLKRIDSKLDDVLRSQRDSVVSRLIGAGLAIDEAVTVSRARGKVDEVTWSKVQGLTTTIAEVQGYALAQLDGLGSKLEDAGRVSDIASTTAAVGASTREWLAVLARSFQLQDALDVLELDRVLDASPNEVGDHGRGLAEARRKRLQDIGVATERLLSRIVDAAGVANTKVLLHPGSSPKAVRASVDAGHSILDFNGLLGLHSASKPVEVRPWSAAAADVRERAVQAGTHGAGLAKQGGGAALRRARDGAGGARRSAKALSERVRKGSRDDEVPEA